jgi:L-cysteine:1D-myo-inositol 2-amino-2-deoxy-alpha-D-glucopyranoside ligase
MDALGLLRAASEPRATSAIPDILGFVGMVLASGHAYQAGGAVYFDVSSWPGFGSISHYGRDKMLQLARERGGNPGDPNKSDPLDFVLWQPSGPGEPAWDSLWGRGRPGWHIECSALAVRELGITVDLHGGGSDLIFPHHECEAAQSEAATGELFVRHWAHAGMVRYEGTKMSKSLGNLVFVRDLLKTWEPAVIRLAVLAHHYRSDWDWHEGLLPDAADRLALWRKQADAEGVAGTGRSGPGQAGGGEHPEEQGGGGVLDEVRTALDDDLSTPRALAAIDAVASDPAGEASRGQVLQAAALLGVKL